eukprot:tig00001154_g7291.t1
MFVAGIPVFPAASSSIETKSAVSPQRPVVSGSSQPTRSFMGTPVSAGRQFGVSKLRPSSASEQETRFSVEASTGKRNIPKVGREAKAEDLLATVDTFIFDCDGVVWKGDEAVEGAAKTIEFLKSKGKRVIFVTNNSTKSRKGYLKKFVDLGLPVEAEQIFSSSFAAAGYLESIKFKKTGKKVYVVGETGIEEELALAGIPYIGGPSDGEQKVQLKEGELMGVDESVGAVVVGFDRYFNYYKIQYAVQCLRELPSCLFIATNQDAVTHLTSAQEWAGAGSMVGAIKASSGVDPVLVGKPAPFMLNWMCERFGIKPEQICMVGDRLDTDILFGLDGGLRTMLVLTGVTSEQYLLSPENKVVPDYYADSIFALTGATAAVPA